MIPQSKFHEFLELYQPVLTTDGPFPQPPPTPAATAEVPEAAPQLSPSAAATIAPPSTSPPPPTAAKLLAMPMCPFAPFKVRRYWRTN